MDKYENAIFLTDYCDEIAETITGKTNITHAQFVAYRQKIMSVWNDEMITRKFRKVLLRNLLLMVKNPLVIEMQSLPSLELCIK